MTPPLIPLAWDSGHFGFPVARVEPADLDDGGLETALAAARRDGFRLVYWAAPPDRVAPDALLRAFGGLLADRKVTYAIDDLAAAPGDGGGPHRLVEATRGPAPPRWKELAVAAGEYSRFRRDPRVPPGRFRALYETWIDRSARGELADAVLLAFPPGGGDDPVGLVTLGVSGGAGSIGLIAVDERARGQGLGRRLVAAAHDRMRGLGASRASVVTQGENAPACALYERAGYRTDDVRNVHHFWP